MGPEQAAANGSTDDPPPDQGVQHQPDHSTQPAMWNVEFAKNAKRYLHDDLRQLREVMLWKLEGVDEYDLRRPLTRTGTNLLGLANHVATWEARYLGEVFDRPFAGPLPHWSETQGAPDLWVPAHRSVADVVEFYRLAAAHGDETIDALALAAPGYVPWWPRPHVTLFNVMVHLIIETSRHAGHADILREEVDGTVGAYADQALDRDASHWEERRAAIESAAREARDGASPESA